MRRTCFLLGLAALGILAWPAVAANQPSITQHPVSQATTVGQPVVFTVSATGDLPFTFEWRRDGGTISGATNDTYTLASAQLIDDGAGFSVVVGNSSGSATSTVAILTVNADDAPPSISKANNSPDFMMVRVAFSERINAADANDEFNYALDGGIDITAAMLDGSGSNVVLSVSPALTEGNGYTLTVSGIHDLANNEILAPAQTSFQAAIAPVIQEPPNDRVVSPGGSAVLMVMASGTNPKSYQWLRNGNPIAGATASDLTLTNIQTPKLGAYRAIVSNAAGSVTSAVATISFLESYVVELPIGYSFVAKQLANNSPQFPVPSVNMTLWKWAPPLQGFETYDFVLGVGWSPGEPAVAVGEGVVVSVSVATSLLFEGGRTAPVPVNLQPGLNLRGAQTPMKASYAQIIGAPQEGSVMYRYKAGGDPSLLNDSHYKIDYFRDGVWHDTPPSVLNVGESAFFSMVAPVMITQQPMGITNATLGQSASFSVTVTGAPPIHYQWQLNGQAIPGATNPMYFIQSVAPSNAGIYSVAVGNLVGDISSAGAPLTVNVAGFALSDAFSAAPTANDSSRLLRSHNRNATTEPGEPPHGGKRTGASVWLTWVAPTTGIVTMTSAGSSFDTVLAAYLGNDISNLTLVDVSDDEAGYACGKIRFNARAGVAYRICVSGLGDNRGDILLGWNLESTTHLLPELATQPLDVTATYGDTVQFGVNVTNQGPFTYLWFQDDVALSNATSATLTLSNLTDAHVGTYHVRVSNANRSRDSRVATLQIEVAPEGTPLSGARATAKLFDVRPPDQGGVPLKGPRPKFGTVNHGYSGAQTVSSAGAGKDPGEPNHCGVTGGNSIWYVVQADDNGTMYMNTDGSSFNTVLAVYTGPTIITSYSQLTNVACDNNSGLDGLDSRTGFTATSNTIYYAAVDGVGGASGTVKIAFKLVRPLVLTNLVYTNISGGRFTMKVSGTPNLAATVQFQTNVAGLWTTLTNYTAASGTFNFTNNNVGSNTNRIYRALNSF